MTYNEKNTKHFKTHGSLFFLTNCTNSRFHSEKKEKNQSKLAWSISLFKNSKQQTDLRLLRNPSLIFYTAPTAHAYN